MNKIENNNSGSYVEFMISRLPMKNQSEMLKLNISKFDLTQLDSLIKQRPGEENK
jgi:hypothetical protein